MMLDFKVIWEKYQEWWSILLLNLLRLFFCTYKCINQEHVYRLENSLEKYQRKVTSQVLWTMLLTGRRANLEQSGPYEKIAKATFIPSSFSLNFF